MTSDAENNSEAILEKTAINMLKEKLDDSLMALLHESDFGHNSPFPQILGYARRCCMNRRTVKITDQMV